VCVGLCVYMCASVSAYTCVLVFSVVCLYVLRFAPARVVVRLYVCQSVHVCVRRRVSVALCVYVVSCKSLSPAIQI